MSTVPVCQMKYECSNREEITDTISSIINAQTHKITSVNILYKLHLVLEEALTNIFNYNKPGVNANLSVNLNNSTLSIKITDNGIRFNPLEYSTPTNDKPDIETLAIGGAGILILKKFAKRLNYRYNDGQNILTIILRIQA